MLYILFRLQTYEKKIGTNVLFVTYLIKNEKKMARIFDICVFFCFFAFENY